MPLLPSCAPRAACSSSPGLAGAHSTPNPHAAGVASSPRGLPLPVSHSSARQSLPTETRKAGSWGHQAAPRMPYMWMHS